jgi:hypothetical protein
VAPSTATPASHLRGLKANWTSDSAALPPEKQKGKGERHRGE